LDGVGSYVDSGNDVADYGTGDFSIVCFIKIKSANNGRVYSKRGSGQSTWISLIVEVTTRLIFSTGSNSITGSLGSANIGSWQCVIITKSGANGVMYINGIEDSNSSSLDLNVSPLATPFLIGKRSTAFADIDISKLDLYNRVLTNEEIINYSKVVSPAGLNTSYNFQDAQGTKIADSSGNGNHGTLIGAIQNEAWGTKSGEGYPALLVNGGSKNLVCTVAGTTSILADPNGENIGVEELTNGDFSDGVNSWTTIGVAIDE
jgi:hypothetical protein